VDRQLVTSEGLSVLGAACKYSDAAMVEMLIKKSGFNPNEIVGGATPLMHAVTNLMHAKEVADVLLRKFGADLDYGDSSAVLIALHAGGTAMETLKPHISPYFRVHSADVGRDCPNPFEMLEYVVSYGNPRVKPCNDPGTFFFQQLSHYKFLFFNLRNGILNIGDIHSCLSRVKDLRIWKMCCVEAFYRGRSSDSFGNSLLHLIVGAAILDKPQKVEMLQFVKNFGVNPFLKNVRGRLAIDETDDADLKALLQVEWRPNVIVSSWYDTDYLVKVLMVFNRIGLRCDKNVKYLILKYLEIEENLVLQPCFETSGKLLQKLATSQEVGVWKSCCVQLFSRGQAMSHDENTLLHLIVSSKNFPHVKEKLQVLRFVLKFGINPFCPNKKNQTALDLAGDDQPEIVRALREYQQWRPNFVVNSWYGPYCTDRIVTMLLVLKRKRLRLGEKATLVLCGQIARLEGVWVYRK
jgi:hypothetical protein